MRLQTGNMFEHPADLILVTTNSFVKTDGRLVMGRGAAKDALRHFPGIDLIFGGMIKDSAEAGLYGLLIGSQQGPPWEGYGWTLQHQLQEKTMPRQMPIAAPVLVGAFQVKFNWWAPAQLELIGYSTDMLLTRAANIPLESVSLNFPGIGNGGLKREEVLPIIERLPANVTVWEK